MKLLQENNHAAEIFEYVFSYEGTMTIADLVRLPGFKLILNMTGRHLGAKIYQKKLGACHGDDLFYAFPFSFPGFPRTLKTGKGLVA